MIRNEKVRLHGGKEGNRTEISAEETGLFSLERRRLRGHLISLQLPDRRVWGGGGQALLPCLKRKDQGKQPQVASGEVQTGCVKKDWLKKQPGIGISCPGRWWCLDVAPGDGV